MKFSQTGVNKYLFGRVLITARFVGQHLLYFRELSLRLFVFQHSLIIYGRETCFYLTFNLYVSFELTSAPSVILRSLSL